MAFFAKEIEHRYGPQFHILDDPLMLTLLAQASSPETFQPKLNLLIGFLYKRLLETVVNQEFPQVEADLPTRMTEAYPQQRLRGRIVDSRQTAVSVNLARAGTVPSHICYEYLNYLLNPASVRQDHIFAARITNSSQQVTGAQLGTAKIGGGVENSIVLFPDPMGATGNTLVSALDYYKKELTGRARKYIALHLIVTPEYIKNVKAHHPDLIVYAFRLDRGLSTPKALSSLPGERIDEERGLTDKHYIVPGAGGLGEVLNNSFV